MGIGVGIFLVVLGLIFLFALNINIPYFSDDVLGVILLVAGILAIMLGLIMNAQRSRTRHVREDRYEGPPPQA